MTDLTSIPTLALLAEVDRRAKAEAPPRVLFFGVWPGENAGHYVRQFNGQMIDVPETTFGKTRDGGLYPWSYYGGVTQPAPQDEGKLWHWHHPEDPMTLLLSWDRSADRRGGCVATFIIYAHVTPEHGLRLARATYPRVFERIALHLGRPTELAGPVPTNGAR